MRATCAREPGRRRDRLFALLCIALLAVQMLVPPLHRLSEHRQAAQPAAPVAPSGAEVSQCTGEQDHDEDSCALCQHFVANERFTDSSTTVRVDGLAFSGVATPTAAPDRCTS